jgi:hypothetical protein
MRDFIIVLVSACMLAAIQHSAHAAVVLNEQFTDGDLAIGSDPQDGQFLRQGGTSQTLGITTDGTIGGGNAGAYGNQVNGTLFIGRMRSAAVLGTNAGDRIRFSFDFRMTALPTSPNSSIFRFGLYGHSGATPTDGGSETNPDSGYIDNFGAGGSAGDAGWGSESSGNDSILGGSGAATLADSTTIHPVDINETTSPHHVLAEFTRAAAGGMTLQTTYDGVVVDTASDPAPFSTFDEVAFRLTGQASADYDNILVETVPAPEPTMTASMALIGIGALLARRGRSRR